MSTEQKMLDELKKIREALEPKPAPPPPKGLWAEFKNFIENYKVLGLAVAFIMGVYARARLRFLRGQYEYIEIPMEEYEKLQQAIRDMDMGFLSVDDFIDQQVRNLLEKHVAWTKQKEDYEKR